MALNHFLAEIQKYGIENPVDIHFVLELQALVKTRLNAFLRSSFEGGVLDGISFRGWHVTASMLVVNTEYNRVLLMRHTFLQKLLQFGGHSDGNMDPLSVAMRECMEESWLTEHPKVLPGIFNIDIHTIPENSKKSEPAHSHYDVLYLATIDVTTPFVGDSIETQWVAWYDFESAKSLIVDARLKNLLTRIQNRDF